VHFIETSPALTEIQQKLFRDLKGIRFFWHTNLALLPEKPMVLVANELFDALPVHQYLKTSKGWREKMVGFAGEDEKLSFMLAAGENTVTRMLTKKHPNAPEGAIVEWCPVGIMMMEEIASRMRRHKGSALIIDYGYEKPGFMETIQAIKAHRYYPVLETPGYADITAHVDFQSLIEVAKKHQVDVYGITSQADFLRAMGIETRAKALLEHADVMQQKDLVSSVERLMSPSQMGELFKVLAVTTKDMPKPAGF
jgi:SAM-dependent MidA family methyltransferase